MTMALEDATNPMQGVSGPGKFAKRTDLQYQSTGYGDGVEYDALKAGAPLAKTPDVSGATPTEVRAAAVQRGRGGAPVDREDLQLRRAPRQTRRAGRLHRDGVRRR